MKNNLVSINNSGECLEKVLTLYYYAYIYNKNFYNNYNVILYYGNNLSKNYDDASPVGTIGFYVDYFSGNKYLPDCSKSYIMNNKEKILTTIKNKNYISNRSYIKLMEDDVRYWKYIKNIPLYYLYPEYFEQLITKFQAIFNVKDVYNINLEKNILLILKNIDRDFDIYKVYGLISNGDIGTYSINYKNDYQLNELKNRFSKLSVLSGNSALLLKSISSLSARKYILGYRKHKKQNRYFMNKELNSIIKKFKTIEEPKNNVFNDLYLNIIESNPHIKNDKVYAYGFNKLLNYIYGEENEK